MDDPYEGVDPFAFDPDEPGRPWADPSDGCRLLDDVREFLCRFVAYPSEHAANAHALWILHAWMMDRWESTARIAFLSPEPGSGKSRALEVTEPLVPRPVDTVNSTPAYLFRKVSDPIGPPTLLYDEIDTVFGPRAKENEDIRGMLNAGHRRGATAGRCVVRGKIIETEELPAYCAVALAGLNDLPDTIATRSIIIRMRKRGPAEAIEPWRRRIHGGQAVDLAERIHAWAARFHDVPVVWPDMPDGIADRDADVWESLLIVADEAGGHWPTTARVTAVTLVTDSKAGVPTIGIQLLADIRTVFDDTDVIFTEELLTQLVALEESPWGDIRGKALDARGLSRRLARYGISPKTVRVTDRTAKGYTRGDFADTWSRYLPFATDTPPHSSRGKREENEPADDDAPLPPDLSVTSVTASHQEPPEPSEADMSEYLAKFEAPVMEAS